MRKHVFILMACMAVVCLSQAQTQRSPSPKKEVSENIYTPLKPSDGQPANFSSREDLQARVYDKKMAILGEIKSNASDPVKVKQLREQLWRFENAVVVEPTSK